LRTKEAAHDLIVSADTLVYFGALESVLGAASQALRPGGLLLFTVEAADEPPDDGYRLNAHGRYSHSKEYLERVIPGAGLTLASLRSGVLRKEGGHPANGWMAIARRPNPQLQ